MGYLKKVEGEALPAPLPHPEPKRQEAERPGRQADVALRKMLQ